jgi:hypothetical protein
MSQHESRFMMTHQRTLLAWAFEHRTIAPLHPISPSGSASSSIISGITTGVLRGVLSTPGWEPSHDPRFDYELAPLLWAHFGTRGVQRAVLMDRWSSLWAAHTSSKSHRHYCIFYPHKILFEIHRVFGFFCFRISFFTDFIQIPIIFFGDVT